MLSTRLRLLFVFISLLAGSLSPSAAFAATQQVVTPIRVGICESDVNATTSQLIEQSIDRLQTIFDGSWTIRHIDQSKLGATIEKHETDVLFLSSAQFTVTERFYGLNALAGFKFPGTENTQKVVGVSVLSKDPSLKELSELSGKRIGISKQDSFLEILLRNTLRHRGIDPDSVQFVRLDKPLLDTPDVIPDIDTIALPACKYELDRKQNSLAYDGFNPIGAVPDPEFPCLSSTALVPGFVVATLPQTDKVLAEKIRAALLSQPPTQYGSWGAAANMIPVSRILLEEVVPSFLSQEQWRWDRFFFDNWFYFLIAAAVLVGIFMHGVILEFLVRKRTHELIERTVEKEAVQARNRDIQSKFDALEKTAIVGQLSSMVAHELKQPLTAIHNYADGLHRLARKGINIESDMLLDTVERIDAAGQNAVQIIDHVRGYAKQENRTVEPIDMNRLLTEVLASIQGRIIAESVEIQTEVEPTPLVLGNKLELQLLLRNLLKNALDAVKTVPHPMIDVRLLSRSDQVTGCKVLFEVIDNGPVLSKTQIEALSKPLVTTKEEGLGLGIAIVRRIVESHCGHIQFEPRNEGGLHVTVRLPD